MDKKLIGIILGAGAIIAIGLGIFLSFKSKEIKSHMQQTLNERFESFAQESGIILEWEPFSCGGLINIGCYSPKIVMASDDKIAFILKDTGFDIDSMDNTSLQLSLNIKELQLKIEKLDEADEESFTLLSHFIPNKIRCNLSLKQNENKLFENSKCAFTAKNADYEIQGNTAYQHESFTTQNIAQILESFYFNIFLGEEDNFTNQYKYALDKILFKVKENGFSQDMYKFYESQSKIQGTAANEEGFKQYAKNTSTFTTFIIRLMLGEAYQSEIISFGDALESFILGNSKEIGFSFQRKQGKEEEFVLFEELDFYSPYFMDNYTFEVISH